MFRDGETKTAIVIHRNNARAQGRFVEVPCPSIPDSLVESELFGHVPGAFTDAKEARSGLAHRRTEALCSSTRWAT